MMKRNARFPRAMGVMTRIAFAHAKARGIGATALLERAGMSRRHIEDARLRIRVRDQVEFLNLVGGELADELLGFHLAQACELRAIGLYYYVLASSGTVTEVCQRATRYSALVNEGVIQQFVEGREIRMRTRFAGVSRREDRHQLEFWSAIVVRMLRELTGTRVTPLRVCFAHPRKSGTREMANYFGCKMEFDAAVDEMTFAKSTAALPVINADPYLNRLLVTICEEALPRRAAHGGSVRTRVENEIAALLPHGKARAALIARQLGMSQRTLARHLAAEGESFTSLLCTIRRDLAARYLKDETLSMSQIAWLLGFQDPGAFSHAFRRWNGMAPRNAAARVR